MQVRVVGGNLEKARDTLTKCCFDIIMEDLRTGGKLVKKLEMLAQNEIEVLNKLKERNLKQIKIIKESNNRSEYIKGYTDALKELNKRLEEELKELEA
ncbi:hypothetical protein [Clostridium sp. HV4-5-A1G]|uniref:hypothetical protein n=1 Tax=Clostridium sp. HV4-5-A1G TaxID=2004595 RepID=UPI00123C5F6B|nr:hypothetical protein [Clostridium sp. HV4-5-A1G]KAA8673386.1 hypothetical protein F3O63_08835 [Clostridium sp. HV4-5-A1G]